MRRLFEKAKTSRPLRRGAGIALITLGVIGTIAPVMPGVVFIVLGGSLLEIEHRAFNILTDFIKSENKIQRIGYLYRRFYSVYLPNAITSWKNKKAGREPVLTRRNIFVMTYIAIGMSIFLVSGVLLTKSYFGLHLETRLAEYLNIPTQSAINLISALGVLPLMFIILGIVKKQQRTVILLVIIVYALSLTLSVMKF